MSYIKLGQPGAEITLPEYGRDLQIKPVELNREERTVDGTLVSDLIAVKHVFTITFELIGGVDLENLLDLYDLDEELNLIIRERDLSLSSYTVLLRPLNRKRISVLGDWLWGNVPVVCEEV